MYEDYPDADVIPRVDEATRIWRYMDFTNFVSALDRQALFFASGKLLQEIDPFEGVFVQNPKILEAQRKRTGGMCQVCWTDSEMKLGSIVRQSGT